MDLTASMFTRGMVSKLASLPQVLLRLLEVYDSGAADRSQLLNIVSQDAALSAKILCVAHAGVQTPLVTLDNALAALDVDAVRSMAIDAAGHPLLLRYGSKWLLHLEKLWIRSLTCAALAKTLAEAVGYPATEEAYLAGLLHNVGQLALGAYAPDQYPNLLTVERDGPKLIQLELSHFNTTHYQVGAALVESWHLQSFMADALRYQAESADKLSDAHPLVKLVHLARGLSGREEDRERAGAATEILFPYLEASRVRELVGAAGEQVGETARMFGIQFGERTGKPERGGKLFELTNRVRHIAILDGVSQPLTSARDEQALMEAVQRGVGILIGDGSSCVLIYDPETDMLVGRGAASRSRLLQELRLPARSAHNLPGKALVTGRVVHSGDTETDAALAVVDRQLLDLLGAQAMLCMPLVIDRVEIGVLVLGVEKRELPYPQERLMLLRQFAQRAAAAIAGARAAAGSGGPILTQAGTESLEWRVRQSVHEARNPLTTVRNYVQILSKKYAGEEWAERDLKIIRDEVQRVEHILRSLVDLSEGKNIPPEPESINRIIFDLMWVLQASILDTCNVKANLDLADDVPPLSVDSDGLKQVISNLVSNACDAMPHGGDLTIRTRANLNINGRLYVDLSISDNGIGMAPEIMSHLFESGATTKGGSHGGLGLAIVKDIVRGWGGSISCRSGRGGTSFDVLLPCTTPAAEAGDLPRDNQTSGEDHIERTH